MNARTTFEPYRVILDYEALEDMFLDRIEDLNTTFTQIDDAGGLTRGETQKLLSKSRERWARTLGITSMGKMLKGTGIVLVAVVDDERFAAIKAELIQRKRPRKPAIAGSARPTWLFGKKKAREMGKRRFAVMTESERKRHQRKAGKASGRARRRKARQKTGALLNNPALSPCANGHSPPHAKIDRREAVGDQTSL
jgi:hypothetical protein